MFGLSLETAKTAAIAIAGGFVLISILSAWLIKTVVTNVIVIVLMLTVFALAVFVPFPKDKEDHK